MLCVVEPRMQSIETAKRIKDLSTDLGVKAVLVVANKVKRDEDLTLIERALVGSGMPIIASVPYDESMEQADMSRIAPLDYAPNSPAVKAVDTLKSGIISRYS